MSTMTQENNDIVTYSTLIKKGCNMNISKLSIAAFTVIALASSAQATLKSDKVTLKGNMQVKFNKLPESVSTIKEAFTEGMFYGRLRTNMFMYDWKEESSSKVDHKAMGVGGSFIYKTAPLSGFSATLGLYTSQNPQWFNENETDVSIAKAGKGVFSRRETTVNGDYGMTVLGQAYIQYDYSKTSIVAGRQIFESVFTKSNDTKMIPNTFDGVSVTIKDIEKTTIQLAYFTSHTLRDHTVAHDVLAYDPNDRWSQNDDAAVNKNLTVERIGDDNKLIIGSVTNKSIKNLKANISYMMVPDIVSNLTLEAHYTIPVSKDWKIAPGIRYMKQFDNLNANYDVANLLAKHDGYKDSAKQSLDTNLLALRLDIKREAFLARLGYSKIADEADIVAPWRGFPTGGFTRAMAQYNWFANTKSYMARVGYDFGKANILDGFSIMARYVIQDTDDKKAGVAGDSKVIHIDARQNLGDNLELKLRLGFVDYETGIKDINGDTKADLSYNEYRFELNYFF